LNAEPVLKYKPKSVKQPVYTVGFYRPFVSYTPQKTKKTVRTEIQFNPISTATCNR